MMTLFHVDKTHKEFKDFKEQAIEYSSKDINRAKKALSNRRIGVMKQLDLFNTTNLINN